MNLSKSWDLHIDPDIFKILKRLPSRDAEAILDVIRFLPSNPFFGDIQKMKGEDNAWRRRVGSYRIFYKIKITEKVILVFRLERRTSSTY
ncbi:MAG: type II toxin-antitoxin system RelE/ParE family toxin [Candidatus Terrybacteria bacterium]|nr:type II toxin-antitoxin system RelE/ParE family toxin [Candidatus Terrybacteria bacterium]